MPKVCKSCFSETKSVFLARSSQAMVCALKDFDFLVELVRESLVNFFFHFKKMLVTCAVRLVFVGQSIFVVEKRLVYEKISIFHEESDGTKIK